MKRFLQRKNTRMYHVWLRSFMVCLCLALAGVSAWGQEETMEIWDDEDLYEFAKRVNNNPDDRALNAILMNDIIVNETLLNPDYVPDMSTDKPWGGHSDKEIRVYEGTFNGNGFAIKGLYIVGRAFIEVLRGGGKILNLGIVDSYMHCKNSGDIAIICGKNEGGQILNCYTNSTIRILQKQGSVDFHNIGSICGTNNGGLIKNCYNTGLIEYEQNIYEGVHSIGGICGTLEEKGIISQCYNEGNINITTEGGDTGKGRYYAVGGVLGCVQSGNINAQSISECYNSGNITIQGGTSKNNAPINLGGVVGKDYWLEVVNGDYQPSTNMKGCYNTGALTVKNLNCGDDVYYAIGGVSGVTCKLEGCYNTGEIKGDDNTAKLGIWLGNLFSTDGHRSLGGGEIEEDQITILDSYYKESVENVGQAFNPNFQTEYTLNKPIKTINGATEISDKILESGEMAWALREYGYGLTLPNESKAYPKLQSLDGVPAVYKLTLKKEGDNSYPKEQYCNSENLNLPEVPENFGWFDSDGNEYFDDSQITEDLVLTVSEKKKYTVTAKVADGCEGMGTVTGDGEYAKGDPVTITATSNEGYELDSWDVEGVAEKTKEGNTIKFTMPANNVTVTATFTEKEDPTDPEEPVDPPVDPINYYNIYNETTYDFIDVSFSRNVVREGGSVNVYLGIPEGLDPAAVTLMFKRSLYGGWENLNTDDDGNYLINNIWTDIYVKAVVDESYIDPNPDENHIYIDLSETNDSIWLYTDHKLVEEGKTAVIQAEVAKSCQNKEICYMYKRTVLGEWKEMPKDYSINQYVVRDITTDIYVKAYFVFDKQDPTTAKNPHHVYADITATCEGLYLDATRHKVADEGDTKVFLYVKKGFETKDARYLFKRGLKGEWEDLVPGIEQNTFQVTDIEGDIYLKGIDAVYTGTEDIDGMVRVYTKDGSLFVYTAQPEEISVVSMTGVTVKRTRQTGLQSYPLNQGIYVICVGEQVFKVRVK